MVLIMLEGRRSLFLVVMAIICAAAFVECAGVGAAVSEKLAEGKDLRPEKLSSWKGMDELEKEEEIARSIAVLTDFKRCVNSSNATTFADWNNNQSSDPYYHCKWTGVACDRRRRVVELRLSHMGLEGTVTVMLANLTRLKNLDLSFNNLSGTVPRDLPRRLKFLILSGNNFVGTIPESVSQLAELRYLELDANRFDGQIPAGLRNCSRLENLILEQNNLTGSIPSTLGELQRLLWLVLASNQLSGKLPPGLRNATELVLFDASGNLNIVGGIPSEYETFAKLQSFEVSSNQISGELSPSLVSNWTALRLLSVGSNHLSGQLPSSLGQLPFLQVLRLHANRLSGAIPSDLANCSSLTQLDLMSNSLSNSIPARFGSISFYPPSPEEYDYSEGNSGFLNVQNNRLSGRIPPSLANCSGLRVVELNRNNLRGNIPAEFGQLNSLIYLYLELNRLTGSIPRTFGNLSQLEELYVNFNELTGIIPERLSFLASLEEIDLGSNRLQGPIPRRIGFMKNLTTLTLAKNYLSGALPSSLANCTQLLTLDVHSNLLTGLIPSSLSKLTELQSLNLHDNQFEGPIPDGLDGCRVLYELNLAHNALNGSIPSDIGNLRQSLRKLYLDWNQLEGPIPDNLGTATNLLDLKLSHNNLTGAIPASVANLYSLNANLDLSHNFLTGLIPRGMGTSMFLVQNIDLSANDLSGGIPESFTGCLNLITLNLSFNTLNETIPPSLGKLQNLAVLDLSVNNLSGQIPSQLADLRELRFLNVSQNQLYGRIPNTGAFSSLTASSFLNNSGLCGQPLRVRCSHSGRFTGPVVAAIVCSIFGAVGLLLCFLVTRRYLMPRTKKFSNQDSLKEMSIIQAPQLRVTPEELHTATEGYSESNLLGMGGSSKVYKGILRDGKAVAVKRLNLEDNRKETEHIFRKECETLGKIRHRNLVQILSTCCNLEMKAIVLDYMPNGSLEKHLFGGDVLGLDWEKMLNIALDVANALVYLHYECDHMLIIHCDLKPSNILLDSDFVAHVGDFGISKISGASSSSSSTSHFRGSSSTSHFGGSSLSTSRFRGSSSTSHFRGSIGYIAPEYGEFGHHSTKGDVYSYGVVLLAMLTRKQPTSDLFDHGVDISTWVKMFLPDMFLEAIDPTLRAQVQATTYEGEVLLVLKIALLCTNPNPSNRPTSKEVLNMLLQITTCRSNSNSRSSNLEM